MVWVSMFCCSALSLSIIRSSLIKPTLICHWLQNIRDTLSQVCSDDRIHLVSCLMWFQNCIEYDSSDSYCTWLTPAAAPALLDWCVLSSLQLIIILKAWSNSTWAQLIQWKFSLQNSQESSKHWNALLLFDENASLWIFYQKKSFCIGPLFMNHEVLWSWISLVKGLFYQWTNDHI